jgi:N-hydroxyarylamine O-acetyltransferase
VNVQEYLKRIGAASESLQADYESLRWIQRRHMLSVPFENLVIVNSRPIKLRLEALFEKIVVMHRGGYC